MAKYSLIAGIRVCNDFTPETFGRLTTIGPVFLLPVGKKGDRKVFQVCRCSCGQTTVVTKNGIKSGNTKSCGCLRQEASIRNTIHGRRKTPEYRAWVATHSRCDNENLLAHPHYGGRGITVCDRWREPNGQGFINFLADMGERPSTKHSIDRHPNKDGNYEPGNCRWATWKEQTRNKRSNVFVTFRGKTQCLADWALETEAPHGRIRYRLNRGWSVEDAITLPKGAKPKTTTSSESESGTRQE